MNFKLYYPKMNKKHILLTFTLVLGLFACNEEPKQTTEDTTKTAETLKQLVKQENDDFYKKDVTVWSKNFAHTPDVYWMCVEDNVTLRATGWNDLEKFVGDWMKENPKPEVANNQYDDFHTVVSGDLAFLRYKKTIKNNDGSSKVMLEHRTFQNIDGEWKVIGMTSAPGYDTKGSTSNVFMHVVSK